MKAVDPFSRRQPDRRRLCFAAMMMKRRFQVKMGAQQYHQTAGHPRDIQTRSDRELVFLLQKDPTQRTVHVSHTQNTFYLHQLCLLFMVGPSFHLICLPFGARDVTLNKKVSIIL